MMLIATYVAPSTIQGMGLFAAAPVEEGQVIWRFNPEFDRVIARSFYDEAPPFLRDYLDRYAYPSWEDPSLLILEIDNGRFMNHSATPNTDYSVWGEGRARRAIGRGEELTCNYGDFFKEYELVPAL